MKKTLLLLTAATLLSGCRPTGFRYTLTGHIEGLNDSVALVESVTKDTLAVLHETFRFHLLFPCAAAHSHIFAGLAFIVTHSASFFHLKTSKDVPQTRDVFFRGVLKGQAGVRVRAARLWRYSRGLWPYRSWNRR